MKAIKVYCLVFVIACAFLCADFSLFSRIKTYHIHTHVEVYNYLQVNDYEGYISCDLNPICNVTVEGLITDHISFYIYRPIANLINDFLQLDELQKTTPSSINIPNAISISHAILGLIAGFLLASSKLKYRRFGVVLFEFRTLLDNLDGVVARKVYGVHDERLDYESIGFYIDCACDLISIIWLLIVIKSFIVESEYMLLPVFTRYNRNYTQKLRNGALLEVLILACILFTSGTAWNRYLILFNEKFIVYQTDFMRSSVFLAITWMWRLFNIHALLHYIMISIFTNRLAEFVKVTQVPLICTLLYVMIVSEVLVQYSFPN